MGGAWACPADCSAAEGGRGWGCIRVAATSEWTASYSRREGEGEEEIKMLIERMTWRGKCMSYVFI